MRYAMHGLLAAALLVAGAAPQMAAAASLDDLLKQVRESAQANARLNAQREQRFQQNREQQAELLRQAEAELAAAQARADRAKARYEAGQKSLADLKARLNVKTGDDAQVYAAARQAAADFRAANTHSFISPQLPARIAFLDAVAGSDAVPALKDLEELWFTLQQDMTESGKSARFTAEVINADGSVEKTEVVRAGAFAAVAGGRYLTPQGDGRLLALPHQPSRSAKSNAEDFAEATTGVEPILLDPTRGSLLGLEAERPSLLERVDQGGLVGYVILLVGFVGAGLAAWQLVYLIVVGKKVNQQLTQLQNPSSDNPLGRVLATFKSGGMQQAQEDAEVVELRLSEAVLREVPKLERFQAFLRLAVAAGPLLGLIGTVAGMILTFQVITEAGAGDPKLMAAGISQAMIATLLGLGIAIPLLFVNALLAARSRVIVQILDEQSTGLLAQRLEEQKRA